MDDERESRESLLSHDRARRNKKEFILYLPIFGDTYQLTLKVFELTQHFSREYKFTLGQDMKRDCITLVRSIYRANKTKEKMPYLEQFLDEFEVLKLEIRLCKDLHLITIKQQAQLALAMEKIGKQITGWRNASR